MTMSKIKILSQWCYFLTPKPKPSKVILVSGSPRGGTTWLAESILASVSEKGAKLLWEPLQDGNPDVGSCKFSKRPYIHPCKKIENHKVPKAQTIFFKRLIAGNMWNAHTLRLRKYPGNLFNPFKRGPLVIKFVRGNGVVGYLYRRYSTAKPIVLIRNPYAVVASQLKMGNWYDHPHVDPEILRYHPELGEAVSKDSALAEKLTVTWAADFWAAYENRHSVHILFYEDLVQNPEQSANYLADKLANLVCADKLSASFNQPSSTVHEWTDLSSAESKLQNWKKNLKPEEQQSISETLKRCNVVDYREMLAAG